MNRKERVTRAVNRRSPDRAPLDYWAADVFTGRLMKALGHASVEDLLSDLDIDMRYLREPAYLGWRTPRYPDGTSQDAWGVLRQETPYPVKESGTYEHVVTYPLAKAADASEVDSYRWPSPEEFDYSLIEGDSLSKSAFGVIFGGNRLNRSAQLKPMMYLRGVDRALMDLVLEPRMAEACISHITEFYLEYNRRVFEAAGKHIDIFFMGDDFGTQDGLLISLDMWRKYFKKGFRRYIELAHRYGMKVMHHTCGSVALLIPEFLDSGLDILQSLQPTAAGMDLRRLEREFGDKLAFHGGIDITQTLCRGTPQEVKEEVKEKLGIFREKGGYILCTSHNIQPDTPVENVLALYEEGRA